MLFRSWGRWLAGAASLAGSLILGVVVASCVVPRGGTAKANCTGDSECNDDNPCTQGNCGSDGLCRTESLNGPAAEQITHDCVVQVCVDGLLEAQNESEDFEPDDNPCSVQVCVDGAVQTTLLTQGEACVDENNYEGACDAQGACDVECTLENSETVCDDNNACTDDSCIVDSGECEHSPLDGVPAPEQVAGDCQTILCAAGLEQSQNDNTDLPDDAECTLGACNEGIPSSFPKATNTACGPNNNDYCDDGGNCVECNVPTQCTQLPSNDECQQRTCTNNVCGQTFTAAGTALSGGQTQGDCQEVACDGSGGQISQAANGDAPNDNNQCTADSCVNGTPTYTDQAPNTPCGNGNLCNGSGSCVGCLIPSDCGSDTDCSSWLCTNQVCVQDPVAAGTPIAMQMANDCQEVQCDGNGMTQSVADPSDTPASDNQQCTVDECVNGVPSYTPKLPDEGCNQGGGSYCDGAGACVECNGASQCSGAGDCQTDVCAGNTCGVSNDSAQTPAPPNQQTDNDCQVVQCDGMGGVGGSVADNGDAPLSDSNDCTSDTCLAGVPYPPLPEGTMCVGGYCNTDDPPACVACTDNTHCAANEQCDVANAVCLLSDGEACSNKNQCFSDECRDDVCCDVACNGECESCELMGSVGSCTPVPMGTDPDDECSGMDNCDGAGMCE